jgi:uncharacterized protein YggE
MTTFDFVCFVRRLCGRASPRRFAAPTVSAGLLAGSMIVLWATVAPAQVGRMPPAGEAQISATGHVRLKRPPTHLRMYLQITGKGKTLEEALAALKERRETVAAQLDKLGADRASVVFSPPGVDPTAAAQQQRMEAMVVARMGTGARKPVKVVKPPVSVATILTVQWPLAGDSPEKLLVAANSVSEKVKAANLAGGKDSAKLTPEEKEVAEEMAAAPSQGNYDEEAPRPGQARLVFVAHLAVEDRKTAQAEAFAKAKAHAAELAQAAGAALGPLTGLSGEVGPATPDYGGESYGGYNPYMRNEYQFLQMAAQGAVTDEQRNESLAMKPDATGFDCVMNATFAIKSAKTP